MIIFKTVLTDKQIEDYKRPEGTKTYECGGGLNCAFCTLKMLGVYNPELEETSKTCGPRFRAGNMVKIEEYIIAVKQVVADMTDEHHEFALIQEIGQPSISLAKIAANLEPLEACYFIYGRSGRGGHAVVLRKNLEGEVELIDPQRGSDDVGKEFGFTAERAGELGIKLTPQYYQVRGIPAIEEVMIEQSALFKYWDSKEQLMSDLPHFVVGCLMVDSVVGLKMLIDDRDTSRLMDVEDIVVRNPPMDVETESEMEMEGGGRRDEEDSGYSTVEADAIQIPPKTRYREGKIKKRMEADFESESDETEDDWTDALIREISYTTKDDEMFTPKFEDLSETTADGEEITTRTFLDEYGNPKGEPVILQDTIEGGAGEGVGKKRQRSPSSGDSEGELTIEDIKRKKEDKAAAENIIEDMMTPGKEGISTVIDTIGKIAEHFYGSKKTRDFNERGGVEKQCWGVWGKEKIVGEICWLCGFPMNMFDEGTGKALSKEKGGDSKDIGTYIAQPSLETESCDHKLPVKAAHYFQLMYQEASKEHGQVSANHLERFRKLYGNAHQWCNYAKSDRLFLKSTLGDDKTFGEFKEDKVKIRGIGDIVIDNIAKNNNGFLIHLLVYSRKRDSRTKVTMIPTDNRYYYLGTLIRKEGQPTKYYRNSLMYRIHKMENFQGSADPYVNPPITREKANDSLVVPIATNNLTRPSNEAVKKWLRLQDTNIVGGLNELRVLLNSEKGSLYNEGLQVINRKPFHEGSQWWKLVIPYVTAHPGEAEEFKHGLIPKFDDQIPNPDFTKIQRPTWKEGQVEPQSSRIIGHVEGISQPAPAVPARIERENSGQSQPLEEEEEEDDDVIVVTNAPPSAKRPRIVGGEQHLDISVYRGGRRVIDVEI
jgi:hypothetical protein